MDRLQSVLAQSFLLGLDYHRAVESTSTRRSWIIICTGRSIQEDKELRSSISVRKTRRLNFLN